MKLYYAETLAPRKACGLIRHIGAPVEMIYIDLGAGEHKKPEYAAINPNRRVPALVDGDTVIWESNAILCHLAKAYAPELWPQDDVDIIRWFSFETGHFNRAAGRLYLQHVIKSHYNLGPPDEAECKAAEADFRKCAKVLDAHLEGREFLVGGKLTVADFAVAATLPWAEEAHIPLGDFPNIKRWHDGLMQLDGWKNAFPAT